MTGPRLLLSASAQRVQDALTAAGVATTVVEYAASARTSQEAADVLGCTVGRLRSRSCSATPTVAPFSSWRAARTASIWAKVAAILGAVPGKADVGLRSRGDRLRDRRHSAAGTCRAAGGDRRPRPHALRSVLAAGGTPYAMFPIRPADLVRVSGGTVADVALLT